MPARRALLLSAATLAACGFELKRAPELRFSTVQIAGFKPRSGLAEELRIGINASRSTQVVESAAQAQVVFEATNEAREKVVVATTSAGQVRELQLRLRLSFRLRTVAGKELIPTTELVQNRDLSYNESAALAKEHEEQLLYRAMQSDIVSQVIRRLASVPAL
jgi:LPS-assembly lipoprotein